jgi:hypothetical protein
MGKYLKLSLLTAILLVSGFTKYARAQRVVVAPRTVVVTKHSPRVVKRTYYHAPRYDYVVTSVPGHTTVIRHGGVAYHCHQGIYYIKRPAGFVVVSPAFGLRVTVLPRGYSRIVVAGVPYFYYYGVFYRPVTAGSYVVVRPPAGIVVDALPQGCQAKYIGNTEYQELNNVVYQEVKTDLYEDGVGYKVVELENNPL